MSPDTGAAVRQLPFAHPDLFAAVVVATQVSFAMCLQGLVAIAEEYFDADEELVCQSCGCTDSRACPGGCSWACVNPPICSRCATG